MRVILTERLEHEDGRKMERRMEIRREAMEGPIPDAEMDAIWLRFRAEGKWRPMLPQTAEQEAAMRI